MNLLARRWNELPKRPAVYAMYGGWPPRIWVVYVGIARNLNVRMLQHFINRDSSVTSGTAAAVVNPDAVRLVRWWENSRFDDPDQRHAAELVAFDVLEPALRSRGAPRRNAREMLGDAGFRTEMERLFAGPPSGEFHLPWLWDLDTRVESLEHRLRRVEERLGE
jgi:hypothetical protein